MDEFDFIASLLRPLASGAPEALELRDDAAIVQAPPGTALVITQDAISAGVHFTGDEPAGLIARKLLRANLSDLAAMGAEPYGYFLALMLPAGTDDAWLHGFADGLRSDQEQFGLKLFGGDTTRSLGPLALSATLLGLIPAGKALLRCGAGEGDGIYVSGTLGDAALGLKVARGDGSLDSVDGAHRSYLLERYRLPQPRIGLGQALRGLASACMDISDGLVQDMGHVCAASGLGAILEYSRIPLSNAARDALSLEDGLCMEPLTGGDDYELLFTVPQGKEAALAALAERLGIRLTRIGRMSGEADKVQVIDARGNEIALDRQGYRHF